MARPAGKAAIAWRPRSSPRLAAAGSWAGFLPQPKARWHWILSFGSSAAFEPGQKIPRGLLKSRKMKREAGIEQTTRHDSPAFEDEFGLSAHEKGAQFEHPARGWKSNGNSAGTAEQPHHFMIREGMRSGEVHRPGQLLVRDDPLDGSAEIVFVNPGNILVAGTHPASQSEPRELRENAKDCPLLGA